MTITISYTVSETIEAPCDTPAEITQIIVEDTADDAINFFRHHRFQAELKKIERKP